MGDSSPTREISRHRSTARGLPLVLALVAFAAAVFAPAGFARVGGWLAAFFLLVQATVLLRARARDTALVLCSVVASLAAIDGVLSVLQRPVAVTAVEDFTAAHPVLGWGPAGPGAYRSARIDPTTKAVIYEQVYTLDPDGTRRTISRTDGPTVAFVGDSFTFGQGLADGETLPQAFADLNGQARVLNFGFPGYGPQQVLRALETGVYDKAFGPNLRTVVYETAAWQAQRAACKLDFMDRAPRYIVRDGVPSFAGQCARGLQLFARTALKPVGLAHLLMPTSEAYGDADVGLLVAMLARMADIVRTKYGAAFVVAYMSTDAALLPPDVREDVVPRLRAAGLDVVEFSPNDPAYPKGALFIPHDGHPSALANLVWAKALTSHLAETAVTMR